MSEANSLRIAAKRQLFAARNEDSGKRTSPFHGVLIYKTPNCDLQNPDPRRPGKFAMCGAFAWTSVSGAQAVQIVVIVLNRNAQKNGSPSRRRSSLRASAGESTSGVVENFRGRQELVAAAPVVEPVVLTEPGLAGESLDRAFHLAFCAAINAR
jgi:hypothetical protein